MNHTTDIIKTRDKLCQMAKQLIREYLAIHPTGEYLSISFCDGIVSVNNRYWGQDANFPILFCSDLERSELYGLACVGAEGVNCHSDTDVDFVDEG